MTQEKWIWLDMDGTIVDLYGVKDWLKYLINSEVTPYAIAKPIYNPSELISSIITLKTRGYKIGIISWLSKNGTKEYNQKVRATKRQWLKEYELYSLMDSIRITPYGVNKSTTCKKYGYGILVDDEKPNRDKWQNGSTINATENILKIFSEMG